MSAVPGALLVIAAPSGAGKSTLVGRLVEAVGGLEFSVSWTTRPPRSGEREGVDYVFTDEEAFRRRAGEGRFLEWAEVHGNLYGTDREQIEKAIGEGRDLLLDIDVQGAEQVAASGLEAELVFVMPPSFAALEKRLRGRGTEDARTLATRLANATREVRCFETFDWLVVNDDLDRAAEELASIVRACRARRERRLELGRGIVATFPPPGQDGSP